MDRKNDILNDSLLPLLQTLIRNRCVNTGDPDSGFERRSAQTLEAFFAERGIDSEILECREGRSNLLVRIPGTRKGAPSLMYMGHTDVVPAREDDWTRNPFSAEISDASEDGPELWGRGTVDMLNMTASMAVGLAEAYRRKGSFPGDLCFLAVADEEASGNYGARWLTEEHWDKVKTDYMIAELGGFYVDTKRGRVPTITLGEKGIAWLRITVKGTPGHGSMPYRSDNGIVKLSKLVMLLEDALGKPVMHPMFRTMARGLSGSLFEQVLLTNPFTLRKGLSRIWKRSKGIAKFLQTAAYTTVSPNVLRGGEKINVIPDRASCDLDVRLLPGQTIEDVAGVIKAKALKLGISVDIRELEYFPSNVSPLETPLMDAVRAERAGEHGEPVPMMIGGVTDGRFWRSKGSVVYGYAPFCPEMTMSRYASMIHGIDERISLASLERHADFFTRLPGLFYGRS